MNDSELEPWVVVLGDAEDHALAMWRVSETQQPALALFSSQVHAQRYAAANASPPWSAEQPARATLIGIMIACYRQGIELAVLDPDRETARRIFQLRDVLRAARAELGRRGA
jgi:hypothetical protein